MWFFLAWHGHLRYDIERRGTASVHTSGRMGDRRMNHADSIEELKTILEQVNERLLEVSMSVLSEALDNGQSTRPDEEKHIAQARRAVERAIEALRRISID